MAVKSILSRVEEFTGEFPLMPTSGALWRFNEPDPPEDNPVLVDASGNGMDFTINNWGGTSAAMRNGRLGRYIRINPVSPATEKTSLVTASRGIFQNLGERIVICGWLNPTTYSIGTNYVPILSTRNGPGQPIIYLSFYQGRPRTMLYNSSGSSILDWTDTMNRAMVNNGWYFFATVINLAEKSSQFLMCDRSDGHVWRGEKKTFTGTINASCTADIYIGNQANTYYFAGGIDDLFIDTASSLSIDDLVDYFRRGLMANGGDTDGSVDALAAGGGVTLRAGAGGYPESGVLTTVPTACALAGTGRVAATSEYSPGVTAIASIETSTSNDMVSWSNWQSVGASGELESPNREFIRYRVTMTTSDTTITPRLIDIQLHDIPKSPYEKLGFSRPMVLDRNGAWESVLERAYDIVVTGEVNGADTLEFKLPYSDEKRLTIDNEKSVQIVDDTYRIRTLTDEKASDGSIVTSVYAEAAFYDLAYSAEKEPQEYNAALAEEPMRYALAGTGWSVGTVDVRTLRTWSCEDDNALAILRSVQSIHGGDLVFDSKNRLVHLFVFSGKVSGALFAYRKNLNSIKRVVDTRSLITRLYAVGKDGMTFASINGGKSYVEDYTYTSEIRVSTLDLSNFTNPYQMLEFTKMRMAEYGKPRVSYVLSAMDLSVLTGYEHEQWNLGDIVTVDDRDLNITLQTRIIRRQYNLQEPWKTVLELSSKLRELGDSNTTNIADQLDQSNLLATEMRDMVPFNHLRNSRADNGFAYWQNSGFELDAESGVTGTACFKATGVPGTKSMAQTVYPASRRSYTISAQIGSEDLVKGTGGQVGIELVFEYEDGTTETRFIDLY